jgi:hypothetical protein
MRDPDGSIAFLEDVVVRSLHSEAGPEHFLRSALARHWAERGDLVAYRFTGLERVEATRLPFVSYPFEWCDDQLFDAAKLTLSLQSEAVEQRFDLKDASAWNIIFNGCRPVLCDLLSVQALHSRRWWAAGQFTRHFVLPLLIARRRGLRGHEAFRIWRDGMPTDAARRLLGVSRFATRYWPVMSDGRRRPTGNETAEGEEASSPTDVTRFRKRLQASLEWMLEGVRPKAPASAADHSGGWLGYSGDRPHYTAASLLRKRQTLDEWLRTTAPGWVGDMGCNDGEYTTLAASHGANVIAIDADHDCIQALYRRNPGHQRLYPVVAPLDDLTGGRGWEGSEFPGLAARLHQRVDMLMMLAVLHHLAIAAAVPLQRVADFAARCTRRWLVVEWIDATDPQLRALCAQRKREPLEFDAPVQRDAFIRAGFAVEAEAPLAPTGRTLALLERKK